MDKVYIISRYRADNEREQEFNREVARFFCKVIVSEGKVPVAPHLYYTQFLDDNFPDERKCGMDLGIWELQNSKEFLLVVVDGIISEGMRAEIAEVSRLGLPGRIVSMAKQEIKETMKVIR